MSNRPGRKISRRQGSGSPRTQQTTYSQWTAKRVVAVVGAALLAVLLVAGIAAVAINSGDEDPGPPVNLDLSLDEYTITGELDSDPGNIVLDIANDGGAVHNVVIRGTARSRDLRPGESQQLELGALSSGTYEIVCDVPGHTELGMVATLTIK
jgi:hypothetical protein